MSESRKRYFKSVFGDRFQYPTQDYRPNLGDELEAMRLRFEDGESICLLEAVALCALYGVLMPEWAAFEFHERFSRVTTFDAKSWDEAFGAPHPPKTHIDARKRQFELSWPLYSEVQGQVAAGIPVETALREVGKAHGIGMSLARVWYYDFKKTWGI